MTAARKPDEDRGEDPVELPPQPIEYSSTTGSSAVLMNSTASRSPARASSVCRTDAASA